MKAFSNILAAGLVSLLCVFATSSCAVLVIGAAVGTAAYLEGELESHLTTDIFGAVEATNQAAIDLGIKPVSRTGDASQATMIATDWEGRKVTIKLEPAELNTKITEIKIRVGVGGNEGASRRILKQIEKRVGN